MVTLHQPQSPAVTSNLGPEGLDTREWQLNLMSAPLTRRNPALGIGLGPFAWHYTACGQR